MRQDTIMSGCGGYRQKTLYNYNENISKFTALHY